MQQPQIGSQQCVPDMGTGRGLDISWQHNMQIDYARYPGVVENDWPGAEQNPAYRLSENPTMCGIFCFNNHISIIIARTSLIYFAAE